MFNEKDHPRDSDGKFTDGNSTPNTADKIATAIRIYSDAPEKDLRDSNIPNNRVVNVDMDADVQKQLSAAKTSKERQSIAFRYIMDNLRGQYTAPDGRTIAIQRVGADKMTYQNNMNKLRVCPMLAEMIKMGEYDHSAKGENKPNKKFEEFAYYKVHVRIGKEVYAGMLNVGIRKDGSSTLYDLRPFRKQ